MELSRPRPEQFSDSYMLFPEVSVEEYGGETVAAPHDLVGHMLRFVERRPLLKLGNGHYWLYGEYGLPRNTVAVPNDSQIPTGEEDAPVLLAEDDSTTQLMLTGMVAEP